MKISRLHIRLGQRSLVDIDLEIKSSLALVGQSGSGKSLTLKALLGMLPDSMQCELQLENEFELIRGETLGFVPQNPFTALSPLTKIRNQFFVTMSKIEALFAKVGLQSELLDRYAPELSGGQLQRVVLAMALESEPKLLMLDEPTTALDPKTRVLILDLLKELQKEFGFKILFVTHDIASAQALCDEICVIKEGQVIESGRMQDILSDPKTEYTKTLIDANFANRDFRK